MSYSQVAILSGKVEDALGKPTGKNNWASRKAIKPQEKTEVFLIVRGFYIFSTANP